MKNNGQPVMSLTCCTQAGIASWEVDASREERCSASNTSGCSVCSSCWMAATSNGVGATSPAQSIQYLRNQPVVSKTARLFVLPLHIIKDLAFGILREEERMQYLCLLAGSGLGAGETSSGSARAPFSHSPVPRAGVEKQWPGAAGICAAPERSDVPAQHHRHLNHTAAWTMCCLFCSPLTAWSRCRARVKHLLPLSPEAAAKCSNGMKVRCLSTRIRPKINKSQVKRKHAWNVAEDSKMGLLALAARMM